MVSYADLPDIKRKMYLSAIDCAVSENGMVVSPWDETKYSKRGFAGIGWTCDRPDLVTGLGGGTGHGDDGFTDTVNVGAFNSIRARIDRLFGRWDDLPDASPLDALHTNARQAALVLGAATCALQIAYQTQAELWPAARQDIAEILSDAQKAFAARAEQIQEEARAGMGVTALTIASVLAGAAASIASLGTATGLSAALVATAASVGSTLTSTAPAGVYNTSSYDAIWKSLDRLTEQLNKSLTKAEQGVSDVVKAAAADIEMYPHEFDVQRSPAVNDKYVYPEKISIDRDDASRVMQNMLTVIDELKAGAGYLQDRANTDVVRRSFFVGIGPAGPMPETLRLHQAVETRFRANADGYDYGLKNLDTVVLDFLGLEQRSVETLDEVSERFARSSTSPGHGG